jgi:hypothetical protein
MAIPLIVLEHGHRHLPILNLSVYSGEFISESAGESAIYIYIYEGDEKYHIVSIFLKQFSSVK